MSVKGNRKVKPKEAYHRDSSAPSVINPVSPNSATNNNNGNKRPIEQFKKKKPNETSKYNNGSSIILSDDEYNYNSDSNEQSSEEDNHVSKYRPNAANNESYDNRAKNFNHKNNYKNSNKATNSNRVKQVASPVSSFTVNESITTSPPLAKKPIKKLTKAQNDKLKIAREIRRPSPDAESHVF